MDFEKKEKLKKKYENLMKNSEIKVQLCLNNWIDLINKGFEILDELEIIFKAYRCSESYYSTPALDIINVLRRYISMRVDLSSLNSEEKGVCLRNTLESVLIDNIRVTIQRSKEGKELFHLDSIFDSRIKISEWRVIIHFPEFEMIWNSLLGDLEQIISSLKKGFNAKDLAPLMRKLHDLVFSYPYHKAYFELILREARSNLELFVENICKEVLR